MASERALKPSPAVKKETEGCG
ncbi:hypothetical protein CCACVL1_08286 [Corchorus capsularis]|uniref:Uncharacterized protein n=1 Tax=Corchorus capsularis TaxID=210143 RepID=A0A1R3J1D5_COCAP|nr:hypothetical protein CCACVL1_08286 [Corchorus capsularis]